MLIAEPDWAASWARAAPADISRTAEAAPAISPETVVARVGGAEITEADLDAAAGAGNVVDMPLVMGAEDFSLYAREVPGLFFFVGATPVGTDPATAPSNHSPKFDVDESALDLGLRAMLQASLDYLAGDTGG